MGKHQARIAADVILGYAAARRPLATDAQAPRVIFTDPQIASVGHTAASAAAAGLEVIVNDVPSNATAGGRYVGHGDPGTTRFVIEVGTRVLRGATFVGAEVGEWLQAATIAIVGELGIDTLWHAVPAFPSRSEIWLVQQEALGVRGGRSDTPVREVTS